MQAARQLLGAVSARVAVFASWVDQLMKCIANNNLLVILLTRFLGTILNLGRFQSEGRRASIALCLGAHPLFSLYPKKSGHDLSQFKRNIAFFIINFRAFCFYSHSARWLCFPVRGFAALLDCETVLFIRKLQRLA